MGDDNQPLRLGTYLQENAPLFGIDGLRTFDNSDVSKARILQRGPDLNFRVATNDDRTCFMRNICAADELPDGDFTDDRAFRGVDPE